MSKDVPYSFRDGKWVKLEGADSLSATFWEYHHKNRYSKKTIYTFKNELERRFPNTFDHYDMSYEGNMIVFPNNGSVGYDVIPCGYGYPPHKASFLDHKALIEDKIIGERTGDISFSTYRRSGKKFMAAYIALRLLLSGVDVTIVVASFHKISDYASLLEHLLARMQKDGTELITLVRIDYTIVAQAKRGKILITTEYRDDQFVIITDMNFFSDIKIAKPSQTIGFFTPTKERPGSLQLAKTVSIMLDVPEEQNQNVN